MKQARLFWARLLRPIDKFLDSLTSYRLVLYFLLITVVWAAVVAALGKLAFEWWQILASMFWLILVCWVVNGLFAKFLNIARNIESDYITALILTLILSPPTTVNDYAVLAAAGVAAMASKYILTISRRHIFNPAAFGAFFIGTFLHHYPSWWVGTKPLTPVVFIGGLLILRKMQRFTMSTIFIIAYLAILAFNIAHHQSAGLIGHNLWLAILSTPLLFFAFIMLIEPLTSPYKIRSYVPYAVLVGILYGVTQLHISPENALLIGNFLGFLLEPTKRLRLDFVKRRQEADGIHSFIFRVPEKLKFKAGQYLEWTLPVSKSDLRGNRRYFTISSSPTEENLMLTIKLPSPASSFKRQLDRFEPGDYLLASHLRGSFVLPQDDRQKLAFLAGGIGVTPFRSMVKDLLDSNKKRDVTLLYSANMPAELVFRDLFDSAKPLGIKPVYTISSPGAGNWHGPVGPIDQKFIKDNVNDYKERLFYISGPYGFVQAAHDALVRLGISGQKIITDYFPGYG